jgi:hypothetical protein
MYNDSKYKMKVNAYKEGTYEKTGEVEISIGDVAHALREDEKFAEMLGDYMNCYCNEYKKGQEIGKLLQSQHRTLQGSLARLLLGMLVGIGDTEYFDARNEKAVALGKQLKAMIDSGELNFGYMI